MTEAQELMAIVQSRGGRFILEDGQVFVEPEEAALPLVESLRARRLEILALLEIPPTPSAYVIPGDWLLERCVFQDRWYGGIAYLYLDLAQWCAQHDQQAPASRTAFETALKTDGFAVADGLAYGLALREHVAQHARFDLAEKTGLT